MHNISYEIQFDLHEDEHTFSVEWLRKRLNSWLDSF